MVIFVVEDDPIITEGLRMALSQEGYEIDSADCVQKAMEKLNGGAEFDVCLLDVMLPDGDGYQVCRAIRERMDVPILFVTACDDEVHTVLALEQGADDYIAKPFRIRELTARIKAILRRTNQGGKTVAKQGEKPTQEPVFIGDNELDLHRGKVYRNGEEVFLSAVEYRLLLVFARSGGKLLTRQQILSEMWDGAGDFVNDNTLTVYVKRLRKKLETGEGEPLIETVRGIGYRMK